mmetsp:Transcript_14977/g.39799  ORF Transcript_14977/g.39799 Transcript_14977/m.39799 type:complete len:99 (-) Transcript_14977:3-299(-)
MINELSSRTMLLESAKDETATRFQQLEERGTQALPGKAPKTLITQGDDDDESEAGGGGHGRTAVGNPELSYVNLFDDMERLRCVIECMENSMPLEEQR